MDGRVGQSCGLPGPVRRRDLMERDFDNGSAQTAIGRGGRKQGIGSAAVDGEGDGAEQVLQRPASASPLLSISILPRELLRQPNFLTGTPRFGATMSLPH